MIKVMHSYRNIWWGVTATVLPVLFAISIILPLPALAATASLDSKTVTAYDSGVEHTTITQAKTVAQALKDLNIKLNNGDQTDPPLQSELKGTVIVINVKRARPVTVVEGNKKYRVVTSSTDQAKIAGKAQGLRPGDKVHTRLVRDFVANGGAGEQVEIKRARQVRVYLYNSLISIYTTKYTVGEMLREAGIYLQASDQVSVDVNTRLTDNMPVFSVMRKGESIVEETEDIPMGTETRQDSTKKVGYHEVLAGGNNGKKTVVYQITIGPDGTKNKVKINEVVTVQPTNHVEVVGTKVELPSGSHTDWMAAAGIDPSDYGYVDYIMTHESGWNPASRNRTGKYVGLGQTSPASLSASCPNWQVDPVCQLRHFTGYANQRYGGWQNSYNRWRQQHWW